MAEEKGKCVTHPALVLFLPNLLRRLIQLNRDFGGMLSSKSLPIYLPVYVFSKDEKSEYVAGPDFLHHFCSLSPPSSQDQGAVRETHFSLGYGNSGQCEIWLVNKTPHFFILSQIHSRRGYVSLASFLPPFFSIKVKKLKDDNEALRARRMPIHPRYLRSRF